MAALRRGLPAPVSENSETSRFRPRDCVGATRDDSPERKTGLATKVAKSEDAGASATATCNQTAGLRQTEARNLETTPRSRRGDPGERKRPMRRVTQYSLLAILAAVLVAPLVGCSSTDNSPSSTPESAGAPAWIDRPNGAYDDGSEKAIYAVGIAAHNPNPAARRNSASARARDELARTVSTQVKGLVQDYMNTNRDFYDMDGASSIEYFEQISSQVVNETLVGSKQVNAWKDPGDKTEYVLYRIDLDDMIASYKQKMQANAMREMQRNRIKAKKDSFEEKLNEQIDKIEEWEANQFNNLSDG